MSSSSLPKPPWWQVGEGVGCRGRVRVQGSCHLVSRPAGWQTGSWHRVRSPGAAWLRELQPLLLFFFFRVSFWEPTFLFRQAMKHDEVVVVVVAVVVGVGVGKGVDTTKGRSRNNTVPCH